MASLEVVAAQDRIKALKETLSEESLATLQSMDQDQGGKQYRPNPAIIISKYTGLLLLPLYRMTKFC